MEQTKIYSSQEINDALVNKTIREVVEILKERGYDPIRQIVGYIISGDPGYITSHKEARNKISKIERTRLIEVLVKEFLKECDF